MHHPPRASVRHARTLREILRAHLVTLFNGVALLAAIVLLLAGDSFHLSFLPMVVLHALIGIWAELFAVRALSGQQSPVPPVVRCKADGEGREETDAASLQPGDCIRLDAGSPIPADCVIESGAVRTDVSLILGRCAHDAFGVGDALPSGGGVVQGSCIARVVAAGADTGLYRLERDAQARREPRSEMQMGLTRLVRVLSALSIPLCTVKFLILLRQGKDGAYAAASAAGSLMGMLPAALLLLSSAAMLLSTLVLYKQRVLARDLYAVEMFGRIDTLCFDKTGTLTCGTAADVIRTGAREMLAFFREAGVDVYLLTGDTPEQAALIARALDIEGPVVDLAACPAPLEEAIRTAGVFANAAAAQKADIVAALRAEGRCVGMVGDGVNDVAAFRTADCSVAMGYGSDAARTAAQLVLLEGELTALPAIVLEGRSIVGSVTRTAELFVKKSMTSLLVLLVTFITPLHYPFLPVQLMLVGAFTIALPALVLTFERQHAPFHGRFVSSVFFEAVPGTLLGVFFILAALLAGPQIGLDEIGCRTLAVYAYALSGMLVLLHVCRPFNRLRAILCLGAGAALYSLLVLLHGPLSIGLPTPAMFLVLLPLIMVGYPALFLFVSGANRLLRRFRPHPHAPSRAKAEQALDESAP